MPPSERVTADQLAEIATGIDAFTAELGTLVVHVGNVIESSRLDASSVFRNWFGPRADGALSAVGTYLDAIDEAIPAFEAQITVLAAMSKFALEIEAELRVQEGKRTSANAALLSGPSSEQDESNLAAALTEIAELQARWVYARDQWCGWSLPPGNTALKLCVDEVLPPVPGVAYLPGTAYLEMIGRFSVATGIPLDTIDPSGTTQGRIEAHALELLTTPDGLLIALATEVADDGGIDNRDQKVSEAGAQAMTDPVVARSNLQQAAQALGIELSETELHRLTAAAVSTAYVWLAGWNDNVEESIEDRLEQQRDVQTPEVDAPNIENIDFASLADIHEIAIDFDGLGLCLDADGSAAGVAVGAGTCILTTEADLGQVAWTAVGVSPGSIVSGPSASIGAGAIVTNAQETRALDGYALCMTGGGGSGVGGSGTVCGNIEPGDDGIWRFNGVVTAQGNVTATTTSADVTMTLVHTSVLWHSGALNVIREPVEAVVERGSNAWTDFWGFPHDVSNYFRSGG